MDNDEWIRGQLAKGESPEHIIEELVEAGWAEDAAERIVWKAVGRGVTRSERFTWDRILPLAVSGLALLIAGIALFMTATTSGVVATPADAGDGTPPAAEEGDGDAGPDTVTIEISEGVLSAPSQRATPVPARLVIVNNDNQTYTVSSGGLGISTGIAAGGTAAYDIGTAGTYRLEVAETGSTVSFTVE